MIIGLFHERVCCFLYTIKIKVKNFQEMAVSFLAEGWDQLDWEILSINPIECE